MHNTFIYHQRRKLGEAVSDDLESMCLVITGIKPTHNPGFLLLSII